MFELPCKKQETDQDLMFVDDTCVGYALGDNEKKGTLVYQKLSQLGVFFRIYSMFNCCVLLET